MSSKKTVADFPDLVKQWHPTKNGKLKPDNMSIGSHKKIWWICDKGPDHIWETTIVKRTTNKTSCPYCANQKLSLTNSLATVFPEIAEDWHPTKNGLITPKMVIARTNKRYWWKCNKGSDHEWESKVIDKIKSKIGCPFCAGKRVSVTNSLSSLYPQIAKEWHPKKNGNLTPEKIIAGSGKKYWWKCPKGPDHEWQATPNKRTRKEGSGCPFCSGQKVSITNSLISLFPDIAKEWHPTKNKPLTPDKITSASSKKVWWKCSEGDDHEWETSVSLRTRQKTSCPFCARRLLSTNNSLAIVYPEIAQEWHPTKNGTLTPEKVVVGTSIIVWWQCSKGPDHVWQASIEARTGKRKSGCPFCRALRVSITNSLATLYPEIAKEWHPIKNCDLSPNHIVAGSHKKVWWQCSVNPTHIWESVISSRTLRKRGCPYCIQGWTLDHIRLFLESLVGHLDSMTAAELYMLFIQNGLYTTDGKSRGFIKALATGRFPIDQLKKFVEKKPSLVDEFIENPKKTLEALDDDLQNKTVSADELEQTDFERELQTIKTKEILRSLDSPIFASSDKDAIEFFISSAKAKIWKHAFENEIEALEQVRNHIGDIYSERVKEEFLEEFNLAKNLGLPMGYSFLLNKQIILPNLMQRLIASKLKTKRKLGNWSGTGAGKTLSAILASRVIDSKFTIICCPNSVVEGWKNAIVAIYPDSLVETKHFNPKWRERTKDSYRYLILNYEMFQQDYSIRKAKEILEKEKINFIVIDEIQFVKQREPEIISKRKRVIGAFISTAEAMNPNLHVLGMSATPIINNLEEGKNLVEMILGEEQSDLQTTATVTNCMKLHQKLVNLGIRYLPQYELAYEQEIIEIDCSDFLGEIVSKSKKGSPLSLEQILTKVRLPTILANIQPKTLIYTEYVEGIVDILRNALVQAGWKVGVYTGEEKAGLHSFIHGNTDVLIGSSAIKVGVDGLQQVCNRLIINTLPWTNADFEQIKGRVYRQGQKEKTVKMIIPVTFANIKGQRWSWCEARLQRLKYKKSIADAVVDGIVPEGYLRTPAQAYKDIMGWLERLEKGEVGITKRLKIVIPLFDELELDERKRRIGKYGEFSQMNRRWNQSKSTTTQERLQENPEEWEHYHTLYREARKDWDIVPYEEMIKWFMQRSDYVIGDFGCGEAKIAEALADKHTVHSFDHIAINEDVIAGDMVHVPLEDESLDAAIFCLSLMGTNIIDYILEAFRTLKLDGHLHIIESTSRFTNKEEFVKQLRKFGFMVSMNDMWKFTHIHAVKISKEPNKEIIIEL